MLYLTPRPIFFWYMQNLPPDLYLFFAKFITFPAYLYLWPGAYFFVKYIILPPDLYISCQMHYFPPRRIFLVKRVI